MGRKSLKAVGADRFASNVMCNASQAGSPTKRSSLASLRIRTCKATAQ